MGVQLVVLAVTCQVLDMLRAPQVRLNPQLFKVCSWMLVVLWKDVVKLCRRNGCLILFDDVCEDCCPVIGSSFAMGKRPASVLEKPVTKRPADRTAATSSVSVKVASLRAAGYENFEAWLQDDQNRYVGRRGRIFIHDGKGGKRVFHFSGSKWQNPFAVSKSMSRQKACDKYRRALLDGVLKDEDSGPGNEVWVTY